MKLQNNKQMSFAGNYIEKRTRKAAFFHEIDQIIDWSVIEQEIEKVYKKGESVSGRPSYRGIVLFKMLLVQTWYGLSDVEVEDMVLDSLSVMAFCQLTLEDEVPDHSTLSRFRKALVEQKAYDKILNKVNAQLKAKGIMVKQGSARVDASITDSPYSPKGKTVYEIANDRSEDERDASEKRKEETHQGALRKTHPGVDSEARWVKKSGRLHYGYKKHLAVDEDGMVEAVHTTTANEHDSRGFEKVLDKVGKEKKRGVLADKGYKTPCNDTYLRTSKIKNRIQHKAYRNRPLSPWAIKFNKQISKQRWVVERTFGSMCRWFGAGIARYKGLVKTHAQHVMEALAYNLKRAPGLVWAKSANS